MKRRVLLAVLAIAISVLAFALGVLAYGYWFGARCHNSEPPPPRERESLGVVMTLLGILEWLAAVPAELWLLPPVIIILGIFTIASQPCSTKTLSCSAGFQLCAADVSAASARGAWASGRR